MIPLTRERLDRNIEQEATFAIYVFTPMCGTCQVAKRMMFVAEHVVPEVELFEVDLNFMPELAEGYEIESVPCLLSFQRGQVVKKTYAFQSVDNVCDLLKQLK